MKRVSSYPCATVPFALDSGGFIHLLREGKWTIPARDYADMAQRILVEMGKLEWAAVQDWACTPEVLESTGKSIEYHQKKTLESFLELSTLAPRVPWAPVLQGASKSSFLEHYEMHVNAGVGLEEHPIVGVGSIAKDQATDQTVEILDSLCGLGLSLHGFGVKLDGLRRTLPFLRSSDSMAWSYRAWKQGRDRHSQTEAERYREGLMLEVSEIQSRHEYKGLFEFLA